MKKIAFTTHYHIDLGDDGDFDPIVLMVDEEASIPEAFIPGRYTYRGWKFEYAELRLRLSQWPQDEATPEEVVQLWNGELDYNVYPTEDTYVSSVGEEGALKVLLASTFEEQMRPYVEAQQKGLPWSLWHLYALIKEGIQSEWQGGGGAGYNAALACIPYGMREVVEGWGCVTGYYSPYPPLKYRGHFDGVEVTVELNCTYVQLSWKKEDGTGDSISCSVYC